MLGRDEEDGEKERPDEQEILMRKALSWNASSATRNVHRADATVTWLISTFINNSWDTSITDYGALGCLRTYWSSRILHTPNLYFYRNCIFKIII